MDMFITSIIFCVRKSVDKVSNMLDTECWPTIMKLALKSTDLALESDTSSTKALITLRFPNVALVIKPNVN